MERRIAHSSAELVDYYRKKSSAIRGSIDDLPVNGSVNKNMILTAVRRAAAYDACARITETFGLSKLLDSGICVAASSAFTHGMGPQGIRERDLHPSSWLRFNKSDIYLENIFMLAERLMRRNNHLDGEIVTMDILDTEERLLDKLKAPNIHSAWVFVYDPATSLRHVIGVECQYLSAGLVSIFDTARTPHDTVVKFDEIYQSLLSSNMPGEAAGIVFTRLTQPVG